jgi:hypothetical protein
MGSTQSLGNAIRIARHYESDFQTIKAVTMISFEASSVTKRLTLDGRGDVVLVDSKAAKNWEPGRNVFLVDKDGQVLWQIESGVQSHGVVGFSNVYLGKSNELLTYGSNGIEYTVDGATGRILGQELVR